MTDHIADAGKKVVQLDEYRPHQQGYVACMACGKDWVAVWPVGVTALECPECGKMEGELVRIHDIEWFKRFMVGEDQSKRRTYVLLNAKRMEDGQ